MEQVDENVCHLEGEGCVLTFVEAPVFALTAATAFAAGEMGKPCGDASSLRAFRRFPHRHHPHHRRLLHRKKRCYIRRFESASFPPV